MTPIIKISRAFRNIGNLHTTVPWTITGGTGQDETRDTNYNTGISISKTTTASNEVTMSMPISSRNLSNKRITVECMAGVPYADIQDIGITLHSSGGTAYGTFNIALVAGVYVTGSVEVQDLVPSGLFDASAVTSVTLHILANSNAVVWSLGQFFIRSLQEGYITQIPQVQLDLEFNSTLNTVSESYFSLGLYDKNSEIIQEWDTVDILLLEGATESPILSGYIYNIQYSNEFCRVNITTEEARLQRIILQSAHTFTGQNIRSVLDTIYQEIWTRHSDSFSFATEHDYPVPDISFQSGESLYEVMEKLSNAIKKPWKCIRGVVFMQDVIGKDKSSGVDMVRLYYSDTNLSESNVNTFTVEYSGEDIATNIFAKNSSATLFSANTTGVNKYGLIESFIQLPDGDLATLAQEYVSEKGDTLRKISVTVDPTVYFADVQVGDIIRLTIDHTNSKINTDVPVLVTGKRGRYENASFVYDITLQENLYALGGFALLLEQMMTRIKDLEIKS